MLMIPRKYVYKYEKKTSTECEKEFLPTLETRNIRSWIFYHDAEKKKNIKTPNDGEHRHWKTILDFTILMMTMRWVLVEKNILWTL